MNEKKEKEKLLFASREHLSGVLTNLFIAILIWLFGVLVFLPAANQILPTGIPLASSIILLIGFTIFIIRTYNCGLPTLLDAASNVLAYSYKNWKKSKIPIKKLQQNSLNIVYIITILVLYLSYSPFLLAINPALNGLVLIPTILWITWKIFKSVNTLLLTKNLQKNG